MSQVSTLGSIQDFLNTILVDISSSPATQDLLDEIKAEAKKVARDIAIERIQMIQKTNSELLIDLRRIRKREMEVGAAMSRLRVLAQKALEGTLDETEEKFGVQLSHAKQLPGIPLRV